MDVIGLVQVQKREIFVSAPKRRDSAGTRMWRPQEHTCKNMHVWTKLTRAETRFLHLQAQLLLPSDLGTIEYSQ